MTLRWVTAAVALVFVGGCGHPSFDQQVKNLPPERSQASHHRTWTAPGPAGATGTASSRSYTRATIDHVVDGDTLATSAGKVRLLAIDTPEVYFHVECGGPEASAAMKRLLVPGDSVRLHPDSRQPDTDKYGRLLRFVHKTRPGLDDLNREMIREGWAQVYRRFPTTKTSKYLEVQAVAERNDRGVWGLCGGF
jgi:endonuclease YncB( thermonuclease family)